jgi:hypothetical protein
VQTLTDFMLVSASDRVLYTPSPTTVVVVVVGFLSTTVHIGYPKLREHLGATVAYMTVSEDYPSFIKTLDAYRPRFHDQLELPFEYRPE